MCHLLFLDIFFASCSVVRVAAGIAPPAQENKSGIKIIFFNSQNYIDHFLKNVFLEVIVGFHGVFCITRPMD